MHFTRLVVALILLFVTPSLTQHVPTAHKNFSRSTHAKPNNASVVKTNNDKLAETEKPKYCAASFKTTAGSEMQHTHVAYRTEAVEYTTIKSEKHETRTKGNIDTNDKPRTKNVSANDKSKINITAHTLFNASNTTRLSEIKNSEHIDTHRKHETNRTAKPQFQLVEIA